MSKDRRKDLRLVKPDEAVEPQQLDEAADALRRALEPGDLEPLDNEALLAMTLGEDVAELDDGAEAAEAEALRRALAGRGTHPLAELAVALRAAASVDDDPHVRDHTDLELVLALSLGEEPESLRDDEVAEAEAFRHALAAADERHPEVALATSLRMAAGAPPLHAADSEALLALGLGVDVECEDDERQQAAALRAALEGEGEHPLARWATALMAARGALPDLDELRLRRVLNRALDHHGARGQGRGVVYGAIVALAAGIALFLGSMSWLETHGGGPTAAATPAPIEARSTQDLFDPAEPFPARGGESERMGKIVHARAADLRANRFAAWGVR
ncbi:MAG TPA: hypothetical protein ENK57_14655 [Polyangiaceae bacterium]|nr:hypothetical protein [Polyangiaceae bacterium]